MRALVCDLWIGRRRVRRVGRTGPWRADSLSEVILRTTLRRGAAGCENSGKRESDELGRHPSSLTGLAVPRVANRAVSPPKTGCIDYIGYAGDELEAEPRRSHSLADQLPSETKCPDPPTHRPAFFHLPLHPAPAHPRHGEPVRRARKRRGFSVKQLVPSRSPVPLFPLTRQGPGEPICRGGSAVGRFGMLPTVFPGVSR